MFLDVVRILETGHSKRLPKQAGALRVFLVLKPGAGAGTPSGGMSLSGAGPRARRVRRPRGSPAVA